MLWRDGVLGTHKSIRRNAPIVWPSLYLIFVFRARYQALSDPAVHRLLSSANDSRLGYWRRSCAASSQEGLRIYWILNGESARAKMPYYGGIWSCRLCDIDSLSRSCYRGVLARLSLLLLQTLTGTTWISEEYPRIAYCELWTVSFVRHLAVKLTMTLEYLIEAAIRCYSFFDRRRQRYTIHSLNNLDI